MKTRELTFKAERNLVAGLFILFGVNIMSWVPRFPEVKANLGINNGEFGSILSLGSVGALVSLLTVGHIVHRYGAKISLITIMTLMSAFMILLIYTHNPFIFLILNMIFGALISAGNIAVNGQGFHTQERHNAKTIVTLFHGAWSAGALISSIIAGFMVGNVSLELHVVVVTVVTWAAMMLIIVRLSPALLGPNKAIDQSPSIKTIFKGFRLDWFISVGMISAIWMELSAGDWASMMMKERFGVTSGLNAVPYILFTISMIAGRFTIDKVLRHISMSKLIKISSLFGGLSYIVFVGIAANLPQSSRTLAIALVWIGFFLAGLGSSFFGPTFVNAANRRSPHPGSVVMGQLGFANTILIFASKWIIAWTAQLTGSLVVALMIPAISLMTVAFYSKIADHQG